MAVSCQRELPGGEENLPLVYGDVNVSLGQADFTDADGSATKSLISVDTEDFVDAYLFAFNASTKKILTYTDGTPMAIYTTSKTFDWTLAIGTKMDIWVVANPGTGNAWKTTLQSAVTNASLTESDLSGDKLMFKCASSSALKALETSGAHLPMSAMENGITLTSPTQSLSIKVKRLFAKYNIYLDTSLLEAEGYTVKSTYLASSKSNTEVPFFYQTNGVLGGYKQTDVSKLATIDRNTEEDLTTLENGQKVTLYFLENCQGTKTGASKWSTVYKDLGASAVDLCSYMEVGVNVSRSSSSGKEPADESYAWRIYLGKTDMKSDFNVERNLFKTIKLTLPVPADNITPDDGFKFTNTNSLSVAPGETITVPFETSVNTKDVITYQILKNGVVDNTSFSKIETKTFKANATKKTAFAYEGTVALTASSSANEGTYDLSGTATSSNGGIFKDVQSLSVHTPVILKDFILEYSSKTATPRSTIDLYAYYDVYKDGVRTRTNITNMPNVTWTLVYNPLNTTLTGTSPKKLKRTDAGTVTVACFWDGKMYGSSEQEIEAKTLDAVFTFTSSSSTSKTINFEIKQYGSSGGTYYYKAYSDVNVPCDVKVIAYNGDEYLISSGTKESSTVHSSNVNPIGNIGIQILRVGTADSDGVQTTYYNNNIIYRFSW